MKKKILYLISIIILLLNSASASSAPHESYIGLKNIQSKNLFNKNTAIQGKYVAFGSGNIGISADYYASDYIELLPNETYTKNSNYQFAYYDENKQYISGLTNGTYTFTVPSNGKYARFTIHSLDIDVFQIELGSEQTLYESYGEKITAQILNIKASVEDFGNILFVAKSGSKYLTIQSAIDIANDSTENPITIFIMPGVYNESLDLRNRNISLVGLNKQNTIIKDDSGEYANAPLNISGNAYIANLTFISTHDNNPSYVKPGYAVHADSGGAGKLHFYNCIFISNQNSAIGIGLHQDQTIIIENSYLRKNSNYNGGSLYAHNAVANDTTEQLLIVKNSEISTDIGVAFRLDDANTYNDGINSQMDVVFHNNILYSDELGKINIAYFRDISINGGISGQIKLRADSYGNNISELNVK